MSKNIVNQVIEKAREFAHLDEQDNYSANLADQVGDELEILFGELITQKKEKDLFNLLSSLDERTAVRIAFEFFRESTFSDEAKAVILDIEKNGKDEKASADASLIAFGF